MKALKVVGIVVGVIVTINVVTNVILIAADKAQQKKA